MSDWSQLSCVLDQSEVFTTRLLGTLSDWNLGNKPELYLSQLLNMQIIFACGRKLNSRERLKLRFWWFCINFGGPAHKHIRKADEANFKPNLSFFTSLSTAEKHVILFVVTAAAVIVVTRGYCFCCLFYCALKGLQAIYVRPYESCYIAHMWSET